MASTPLLEAASSSWTSSEVPLAISTQEEQTPHGSPSLQVGAVEGLGQDPGGGGLAGAPGPAEQVGVGHPLVPDRVAQGQDDVVLAPDLGEGGRAESPVERLVRGVVRSRRPRRGSLSATGEPAGLPGRRPGVRCDGQVGCGTRPDPLRAAAFRP